MRPAAEPTPELGDFKIDESGRIQLLITTQERIPVINAESGKHWTHKDGIKTAWKAATHAALREAKYRPRHGLIAARFQFQPWLPTSVHEAHMPDTAAHYRVEKSIVDACVEAEVIPEDNRNHNRGQLTLPPEHYRGLKYPVMQVDIWPWTLPADHPADQCTCREQYETKHRNQELAMVRHLRKDQTNSR